MWIRKKKGKVKAKWPVHQLIMNCKVQHRLLPDDRMSRVCAQT